MGNFVEHIKKILVEEVAEAEFLLLEKELNNNASLKSIFEILLSKPAPADDYIKELECEEAFALHMVKMQLQGLL